MAGKIIGNKYGLLILGLLALGFGIWQLNQTEVTCDGQTMSEGDICVHTKRGRTTAENTFAEERESQQLTGQIATGVGGLMALGGAGWIVAGIVRGKREDETPATDPVAAA
ncbi:hypothetical protein QEZ54_00715 [Catellatospora sp. KI3]|uniref:hypothetical protein n=1 Tax=Catellatospora sp. KI3 TaxID=3041620 RepID=UPI002482BD2B|nr:hypothetical protein [Catellatospora sp. KI3]MDI1459479.1 hypothetical protein [Catellatospora sp. KI3]